MSFAINHTPFEFAIGEVYHVKCGNEMDTNGVQYRHMEVLQLQNRMVGQVALLRDMVDTRYVGVGVMYSSTGKVECTNARVIGQFGFTTEAECAKSLGF